MFDEILLPVDGSENNRAAIAHAGGIAEAFGSTIHVLHVVDERILDNADAADELVAAGERLVESVADELEGDGIDTSSRVETEIPRDVIVDHAHGRGIDLVVLGSHGRTGMRKFLLGSVAEGVIRRSDVPVLTVPPGGAGAEFSPYRTVLVPTDGSPSAAAALDPATALSTAFDARLDALSVVTTTALGVDVRSTVFHEQLEERARTAVDDLEERARAAGVSSVGTSVAHGSAAAEIVRYAVEHDVDLVAMGTHGREGVERYLLGSVTERVLRTSSVPVLTVRVPESGTEPGMTSESS
ncbi:universal stress protein [Halorarum halophilum]|uniref:Universal stress protein n=1 Tax=Halorarum halophilum TaxID=2743090 RepID=A0A7D5GMJ9_9EURY|nr:universal stress protein [Halobaculum halophilum]QLG28807.1 universal stress protein [Halobaculum halophilum]